MTSALLERQKQQVDSSISLGRLMWYSVTDDTMVDHKTMVMALQKIGLNLTVPPVPRDFNVFKRVSTEAQRKIPGSGEGITEVWMVREVAGRDETTIVRRVVMEERDSKNRKLSYQQVVDVEFNRDTSKVNVAWLPGHDAMSDPTAHDIVLDILANFTKWKGKLNHYAIREWIRKTILDMGATSVRPSGGIYFLREDHAGFVEKLEEFVESLPGGNECHSLPLADTEKQRKMVKRAVESETRGAMEQLMTEMRNVKKEGKLTPDRFAGFLSEVKRLQFKTQEYSTLLATEVKELDSSLKILHKQVQNLSVLQRKRGEE